MLTVKQVFNVRAGLLGLTLCSTSALAGLATNKLEPGLALTFTALETRSNSSALVVVPNVCLFVESGKSPTPFLPSGRFSATWEGALQADLRGDFAFEAELNGQFKLELNGATVLETSSRGGVSPLSKFVSLNKGANILKATFTSPTQGDAFVRLAWTEKGSNTSPIAWSLFTHPVTSALQDASRLAVGRVLFLQHRCAHCHTGNWGSEAAAELKMDAPSLEAIGARRNVAWMARWILDPKKLRPTAHMPRLLRGATAQANAEAIADYLGSLKSEGATLSASTKPKPNPVAPSQAEAGADQPGEHKNRFESLHCGACHGSADATHPEKISLQHIGEKFAPGKLAEFLREPEAQYGWTSMPNFKLTEAEAKELSEHLLASADPPQRTPPPALPDDAIRDRGKNLVQTSGCLNCHALKLENQFSAPPLSALSAAKWRQGCLAMALPVGTKAAQFDFSAEEREALTAFGATDRSSLARHGPAEFAERQARDLQCTACHGQIDGVPPLELLGGKLKSEWMTQFIAGEISYKPRAETHPRGEPWMEARMPAFPSRARGLAQGLAAQHGYGPRSAPEPPVDMGLAQLGQKLVGKEGGFSCISCHGVGPLPALEVFESEGINLAYSGARLLPQYYRRWLRNPLAIDPQTKMPSYFEDGKSPLTDVLEGDAEKQITALWQYLRLGDKMPAPATGQ
jgi:mono/diheme cytochrome c family protein